MAGINSRTYWEARQTAIVLFGEKKTKDVERTLKESYNRTKRDIQKELSDFYQKYADEDGVTTQAIRRRLNSTELASFKDAAGNYITEIDKFKNAPPQLIAHQNQLKKLSGKAYLSRLDELKVNIDHKLNMLAGTSENAFAPHMESMYEDAYYHMLHNIQSSAKLGTSFTQPGQQQLQAAARTKWNGANYSDRIWANKDKLVAQLDVIIPQSFVRGLGSAVLGRELAETMDVAYSSAVRLIRTESRFVGNRGTKDAYIESGVVDKIMFVATLDGRTSPICQEMDGTLMDVKDGNPGTTMPPLHPYCRSTTIPYFPDDEFGALITDRVSRKDGKTFAMGKYQDYKGWAEENTPKGYVSRLTPADEAIAIPVEQGIELDTTPLMEMEDRTKGLLYDPNTTKNIKIDDTIGEFEQELYEFTGGGSGYSDATKALLVNDVKHLNKLRPEAKAAAARMLDLIDKAPVYSQPLYRVEETDINRDFELKPGEKFTMGMRSFTRSKTWMSDLIEGQEDADFEDPIVFKTTGAKAMNLRPYSYFRSQEESVTAGDFKIVSIKMQNIGGRNVKVVEIEQQFVKPPKGTQPIAAVVIPPVPTFDWEQEFDDKMDEATIYINGELKDKKYFVNKYFKPYEEGDAATKRKIATDVADWNAKHLSWNHESIDGKSMAAYESAKKNPDRVMAEYKKVLAQHAELNGRANGGHQLGRFDYLGDLDDKTYAYLTRIVQAGKAGVIANIEKIKLALPNARKRNETMWNSSQAGGGDVGEDELMRIMLDGTDKSRLPDMVSVDKFNKLVNTDGVIPIQRGLKGVKFADQYKKGKMYYGKGVFGNGTYTAVDKETAMIYGGAGKYGKGALISIGLRPDANLISHSQLKMLVQGMRNARSKFRTIERTFDIEKWGISNDDLELLTEEGRLATALGFDGIYVEEADYLVLLGRDKIYVSEEAAVIDW